MWEYILKGLLRWCLLWISFTCACESACSQVLNIVISSWKVTWGANSRIPSPLLLLHSRPLHDKCLCLECQMLKLITVVLFHQDKSQQVGFKKIVQETMWEETASIAKEELPVEHPVPFPTFSYPSSLFFCMKPYQMVCFHCCSLFKLISDSAAHNSSRSRNKWGQWTHNSLSK